MRWIDGRDFNIREFVETFGAQIYHLSGFCFAEATRVIVNMSFLVRATLRMNGKDEVGDVKQVLRQITLVPVDAIVLKVSSCAPPDLENSTCLETLTDSDELNLVPTASQDMFRLVIAIQDDVVGTKMGVFIVSQGLLDLEADNVKETGESDENKKLMISIVVYRTLYQPLSNLMT